MLRGSLRGGMTWDEVAEEQRQAGQTLIARKRKKHPRAACSRAYYAVYALIAGRAPVGMVFPKNWQNPSHDQVPGIVQTLRTLPNDVRGPVSAAVARLRTRREDADYRPQKHVGEGTARDALKDCEYVFRALGKR